MKASEISRLQPHPQQHWFFATYESCKSYGGNINRMQLGWFFMGLSSARHSNPTLTRASSSPPRDLLTAAFQFIRRLLSQDRPLRHAVSLRDSCLPLPPPNRATPSCSHNATLINTWWTLTRRKATRHEACCSLRYASYTAQVPVFNALSQIF